MHLWTTASRPVTAAPLEAASVGDVHAATASAAASAVDDKIAPFILRSSVSPPAFRRRAHKGLPTPGVSSRRRSGCILGSFPEFVGVSVGLEPQRAQPV